MKMSQAIKNFLAYQKLNFKKTPSKAIGTSYRSSKSNSAESPKRLGAKIEFYDTLHT